MSLFKIYNKKNENKYKYTIYRITLKNDWSNSNEWVRKELIKTTIDGIDRNINYRPLKNNSEMDLSKLHISIYLGDTLFVFTKDNKEYNNKMTSFIGKIAVLDNETPVDLSFLSKTVLKGMGIDILNIFSINLTDRIDKEIFIINEGSTIRYIEIGVISFIGLMTEQFELFYKWNLHSLFILRDGTYRDMKYILSQVGEHGINLWKGKERRRTLGC